MPRLLPRLFAHSGAGAGLATTLRRLAALVPAPGLGLLGIGLAVGLLGTVSGLGLLAGCSRAPRDEVWIIGLDGADWDILEPLLARGDLPNLARLRREGAWGRLRSDEPMLSPILWTSIATGKTADLHGVTWFMSDAPDGSKITVSSRNRWVRAVWNIASENEVAVGVVGWWATWPAEPVKGWIVSDYVGWHSFGVTGRELDVPGKTHPPELLERAQRHFPPPASIPVELLQELVHLPAERLGFDASAGPFATPLQHLRQALATGLGYTDLTLDLLGSDRPRLLALYYEGTDAAEHLFEQYAPPRLPWIDANDFSAFRDVVAGYWKWQDEQLGRLLARATDHTTLVVVSDHGFRTGRERLREEAFRIETADRSHMPDGIVLLHGPGVKAGARLRGADIYDIAPTVLYLLGLPVAQDMKGDVLTSAFTADYISGHALSRVATFETGPWDRGTDVAVDPGAGRRMEEMLRSLGYLAGGDGEAGERAGEVGAAGESAATSEAGEAGEPRTAGEAGTSRGPGARSDNGVGAGGAAVVSNVEQAVNLAVVLRNQGRYEEAIAQLKGVLTRAPHHVEARANLARTYGAMGRLPEAEALYRGLLEDEPDEIYHYEDLALALALQGKQAAALSVFEAGLQKRPEWAVGLAGKGYALHQLGRDDEAMEAIERSLALDPRAAEAHYYRGMILRDQRKMQAAVASLRRALELDPEHAQANQALGTLALQSGRADKALPFLEAAARRLPNDVALQGNLGMAYAMTGAMDRAVAAFERVVDLDPESAEARGQLGGLYAQLGRIQEAERMMREAVRLQPKNPDLHINLSLLYHQTGRMAEAESAARKAVDLAPDVGRYLYQLAMVYGAEGREQLAWDTLERARKLDPSLPAPPRRP